MMTTEEQETLRTLATYIAADQPFRLAIKSRWPGEPEELFAIEEWARAHRDAERAQAHRQAQRDQDRDEVEVAYERGVLIGIEHARQLALQNGRAQRANGWTRDPDAIAGQLEHEVRRLVGADRTERDQVAWLRASRPFSLRDADEFAQALRAAATERGRVGGVALSKEAALGLADALDQNTRLRARDAIARKWFDEEVLGR